MSESTQNPAGTTGADAPRLADLRLAERAIGRGWPISDEKRREIVEQMEKLAAAPETKPRSRAIAVRVLAQLDSLNLRDLHHRERMQHEDGILDLRMRRAEEGKPNDCVAVQLAPIERLPEPEWLTKRREALAPGEN